jgi:hypothetical protein
VAWHHTATHRAAACGFCHIHTKKDPLSTTTPRQLKTKAKKNIGLVFLQKKQEHGEAGTAKQGTEQSL